MGRAPFLITHGREPYNHDVELWKFLALVGTYRNQVAGLALPDLKPLHDVMTKMEFEWTPVTDGIYKEILLMGKTFMDSWRQSRNSVLATPKLTPIESSNEASVTYSHSSEESKSEVSVNSEYVLEKADAVRLAREAAEDEITSSSVGYVIYRVKLFGNPVGYESDSSSMTS